MPSQALLPHRKSINNKRLKTCTTSGIILQEEMCQGRTSTSPNPSFSCQFQTSVLLPFVIFQNRSCELCVSKVFDSSPNQHHYKELVDTILTVLGLCQFKIVWLRYGKPQKAKRSQRLTATWQSVQLTWHVGTWMWTNGILKDGCQLDSVM